MAFDDTGYKYIERVIFKRTCNFEAFSGLTRKAVERYVQRETGRSAAALERIGYKWGTETVGFPRGRFNKEARCCHTLVSRYYWDGVAYDFDALKKAVNQGVREMLSGKKLSGPPPRIQLVDKRARRPDFKNDRGYYRCDASQS